MKSAIAFGASVLASVAYAQQSGPACDAISYDYSSFKGSLTYQSVSKYSWGGGAGCVMNPVTLSGPIAPLDQGLTPVFRGPIHLKQFAVYNEGGSSKKRSPKSSPRERRRRHAHEHFHKRDPEAEAAVRAVAEGMEKRECGAAVVGTLNGQMFTMTDNWGPCAGAGAASMPTPAASSAAQAQELYVAASHTSSPAAVQSTHAASSQQAPAQSSSPSSSGSGSSGSSGSGSWNQVSYYSASSPSSSKNVTFLYNQPYANVGYLPSNGDATGTPASSSQMLNDVLVGDNNQFYVTSGVKMANNPASNNVAYHGFAGNKIFLVEISMPLSGNSAAPAGDMPAFWLLNEQIPATTQYGACSCWGSGCGEFDVHEILAPGAKVGYSTMHMGQQYCGGASNGFARATSGTQKLAVIIKAGSSAKDSIVRVVQLDDSYQFGSSISDSDFESWVSKPTTGGALGSIGTSGCQAPTSY